MRAPPAASSTHPHAATIQEAEPPAPDVPAVPASTSSPSPPPDSTPLERLRYLESLTEVSRAINATLDLDRVLHMLCESITHLLDAPAASVMLVQDEGEGEEVRIRGASGLSADYIQAQRMPLEQSIAGQALAEARIFAAWDARRSDDPAVAQAALREGIVSVACAPMVFHGRPVGALNLYFRREYALSPDQFQVLALLAAQGAVAVTNARLYRESRSQAAEIRASFARIGAALASSLDRTEALKLIVRLAGDMTRAEAGAMFMLADGREGGDLALSAAVGLDRRSLHRFRRLPIPDLVTRAWAEQSVLVISDTQAHPDHPFPALHGEGEEGAGRPARSAICVPVLAAGGPVGVLWQYAAQPNRFGAREQEVLGAFALQAAVAIENARLYARQRNVLQTLQRAFLPELPESVEGFGIGRMYASGSDASDVGGDVYDLFSLRDGSGRLAAVIADVCGKGEQAATLTALAKYTIRAYALEDPDPSHVLARFNDALVPQTDDFTFVTLAYALLDPWAGTVSVASAAHPPVLRCRPGEHACRALGSRSSLIAGFRAGERYPTDTADLLPGDVLVFYTDGVLEARKRKAMFGTERLEQVIVASAEHSAQEIAAAIYAAVSDFTDDNLVDDIALLVLKAQ